MAGRGGVAPELPALGFFPDQVAGIHFYQKHIKMGNLLYVVAVVLIILWLIGFLGYNAGGIIHVLLVIAVIAVILRVIRGGRI